MATTPPGTRALQLPDVNVNSYFLKTFGRPLRAITCECERTAEPSMVQVLHISNGDTINQKLEAKGNRLEQMLAANPSDEQIVEEAYLAALSRFPTDGGESETAGRRWPKRRPPTSGPRSRICIWSILSSKEFLFNH